ncbi:hypothetical protein [Lysinibacillus sp. FSL W8-0992]|uniref:hypothetical protein n=1 Tax=Lysinibacillus sp. FSL W8-0992 TaxID=2954643 RepID=UPI0030F909FA
MNKEDNNEYEIINAKGGKLAKFGNGTKALLSNIGNKISDLPDFARDILKSTEKSEASFTEFAQQDKDMISKIVENKLASGNYTDEELEKWYAETKKVTEEQAEMLDKFDKNKKEILVIVSGCLLTALTLALESRNNKA